jgi:tRNA threonylcarbamoyladenosine biosynthesis protein TsaE
MQKTFITQNSTETKKLGGFLAHELKGGEVVCLSGDLGAGKTTFAQGLLKGLKVSGPYTSPTFLIMKQYIVKIKNQKSKIKKANQNFKTNKIYHIDSYRVKSKDILDLGWEEIIDDPKNIVIIEWADRIADITPQRSLWIKFEWLDQNRRKITLKSQYSIQISNKTPNNK